MAYPQRKFKFNGNLLRKLLLKKIRIVTNARTFTGTLICFDEFVLTLRIRRAGKTLFITIPQNKISAIIGSVGPQPRPRSGAWYGRCITGWTGLDPQGCRLIWEWVSRLYEWIISIQAQREPTLYASQRYLTYNEAVDDKTEYMILQINGHL